MAVTAYEVKSMTCGHCVRAVSQEVPEPASVSDVSVDLESGKVSVTSAVPVSENDVRAAVDEAGYELVWTASD